MPGYVYSSCTMADRGTLTCSSTNAHQRQNAATINPFEDNVPHLSEYTAQEIATLASRLDKQLGPEYISTRPGAGGSKVHYLAAEKVINLANEVFGFNGWSSQIQNVQVDFADENQTSGKISLGLSVIMRVTLRDGSFHEVSPILSSLSSTLSHILMGTGHWLWPD